MKSLASNAIDYVAIQGREENGLFHIQGAGKKINRPYGVATSLKIPSDLMDWLRNHVPATEQSLANTSQMYIPLRAAMRDESVHVQVSSADQFNREYGAAFDVVGSKNLAAFVLAEVSWLDVPDPDIDGKVIY